MFIISQGTLIAGRGRLRYQNVWIVLFKSNYTVSSLVLAQNDSLGDKSLRLLSFRPLTQKKIKVLIK